MPAGGAAGSRKPGARLSGTGVAFARSCPRGVETVVAFAGEKWAFLACFSAAEVSPVSTVAVHGRAMVMVVSCWPAVAVAEVAVVAPSPLRCALCARKFALRAHNGPKWAFYGALDECFRVCGSRWSMAGTTWFGMIRPMLVECNRWRCCAPICCLC